MAAAAAPGLAGPEVADVVAGLAAEGPVVTQPQRVGAAPRHLRLAVGGHVLAVGPAPGPGPLLVQLWPLPRLHCLLVQLPRPLPLPPPNDGHPRGDQPGPRPRAVRVVEGAARGEDPAAER